MASWRVADSSGDGLLLPFVSFPNMVHLALCEFYLCIFQLFLQKNQSSLLALVRDAKAPVKRFLFCFVFGFCLFF